MTEADRLNIIAKASLRMAHLTENVKYTSFWHYPCLTLSIDVIHEMFPVHFSELFFTSLHLYLYIRQHTTLFYRRPTRHDRCPPVVDEVMLSKMKLHPVNDESEQGHGVRLCPKQQCQTYEV